MPTVRQISMVIDGKEHKINMNVATKEENLESLKSYPLFIATVEYFGTGEGINMIIAMGRDVDIESFKENQIKKHPELAYYFAGGKFYENEIPDDNLVWNVLTPLKIKSSINTILSGETESGHLDFFTCYYVNYS